jgi:hypothetical protein
MAVAVALPAATAQAVDPPALSPAASVSGPVDTDPGPAPADVPEPLPAPAVEPLADPEAARPKTADADVGGSISGTVVADGSGAPLSGICAYPFPASGGTNVASATTAADGTYLLAGIPAGNYKVRFQDCVGSVDYAAEYYDNKLDFGSAATLAVAEGGTIPGVNASLAIAGRISGTVVADGTGTGLAGICVSAPNTTTGSSLFRVNTAAGGTYTISGLAPGSYKVKFEDCNAPVDYGTEYYNNRPEFGSADVVSVVAGTTTSGINASMGAGGSISGTIVADGSGTPLAGICAYPYPVGGGSNVSATTSAADGTFTLPGLAVGSYRVRFQDCVGSIDYAVEYYDNKLEPGQANPVTVNASSTTSGINASMAIGGRISGTVVADGSGAPLAGICVNAPFAASNSSLFRVTTGADGTYVIAGMAPASYKLRFEDCVSPIDYATEHYDNKADFGTGNTLVVTSGVTTSGINAALAIGGSVSGTVVADGTGIPLSGICVDVSLPAGGFIGRATSGAGGAYVLSGVAAGSYKVRFEDCVAPLDYAAEYYDNKPDFGAGNLVAVTAGATTSGVNAGLAIGGRISGTVVAEGTGTPLSGICVSAPHPVSGSSIFRVTTGADGTYLISGLAPGSHKVKFEDCVSPIDYAVEYYDNKGDFSSGNLVSVSAGATTSGVNAALALGGRMTGTVVADAGGGPLAGICVSPFSSVTGNSLFRIQTANDGTYTVAGVPVGTYKVKFEDCVSPLDYAAEYFDNTLSFSGATIVSVTAGGTTAGVNAGLAIGGRISGTVVADGTGAPIGGICVSAFNSTGTSIFRQSTAADGTYLINGLAAGNYRIRFEECNGAVEWVTEYYNNKAEFSSANLVVVTAGVTTTGINASLALRPATVKKPADFDGDNDTDRSVYRSGAWFAEGQATAFIGTATDIPVPGDYDNDGDADRAVYREGTWFTEGQVTAFLGLAGDIPVPGDYNGDGRTERAVYRPSVGAWFVEGQATVFFGNSADIPVPGDYDGNGTTDVAVFRPAVGGWYINGQPTVFNGLNGDIPVPGDYDNSGTTDKAIFRPSVGGWYTAGQSTVFTGLSGDIPVAGDYDGDGDTDRAIWRKTVGGWYVNGQTTVFLGLSGDIPLPIPQAIYRNFFTP